MKILFFVLCWFCLSSVRFIGEIRPVFGVQVNMQANSKLYSMVVYIHNGRALTHKKIITREEFILYASGTWPSIYNPQRRNLFEERNIPCGIEKDPITKRDIPFCNPLDSLWKIRYSDYPFRTFAGKGWSNELYKPSSQQQKYLYEHYGIYDIDFNYFLDEHFWQILKDVQDENWIRRYRSI
ncbi:MAG: hypothetical protein HYU67_04330 [Flavobacteriia bacterium]|nr:hypothetical protein [Flavobacteriia bacterium]